VVTSGSEIVMKSDHLLLFTLVTVGNTRSRRSMQCHAPTAQWHCVAIGWSQRNGGWLAG